MIKSLLPFLSRHHAQYDHCLKLLSQDNRFSLWSQASIGVIVDEFGELFYYSLT